MISLKAFTAICLGVTLCSAQTITISGFVKDTANIGIPGATVTLEKVDITTTTGADGSFTLAKVSTQTQQNFIRSAAVTNPIQLHNGKLVFTLSENTPVAIGIYNVSGRQIYSSKKTYGSGSHAIETHQKSTVIFLYKVKVGNESYSFRSSPLGTLSTEHNKTLGKRSALAKQTRTMAEMVDVIAVIKEGYLNHRDSIKTSDTAGIIIWMTPNAGNVTDADGNVYQSVRIGNQVWTVENLKTTKYNDGTPISHVPDSGAWYNLYTTGSTTGAYSYYNNNTANLAKYGALYNWYAVNTGKLAPEGWRVPTDAEWDTLQNYLIANGYNWDGTTIGNKIAKSMAAQTDWTSYPIGGTIGNSPRKNNASRFSALPGAWRNEYGYFNKQRYAGVWWSATESAVSYAIYRFVNYDDEGLGRGSGYKSGGFSVRLLKDLN